MKLAEFKVANYRNIRDSGWIKVNDISAFVGQNEAGKSNLFEALYRINPFVPNEAYSVDEDWPVDDWGNRDPSATVCKARFNLNAEDVGSLWNEAGASEPQPTAQGGGHGADPTIAAEGAVAFELRAGARIDSDFSLRGFEGVVPFGQAAVAGDA